MVAQFILDHLIIKRTPNLLGKIIEKFFLSLRKFYLNLNNTTLVDYNLGGTKITLNFSHDLPLNKKMFSEYDTNIGRIAAHLKVKYPDIQAIDIGANVGDTAIIIRHFVDIPILCIEADKFYYNLLKQNTLKINDIVCENCFIGESKSNEFNFVNYTGSGRLVKNNEPTTQIVFKSLFEITKRHLNLNKIKYLKIDTDGFDSIIIKSNIDYLMKDKPVIFFEYDPYLLSFVDSDNLKVFKVLKNIGYEKLLIYDNTGDFLISLSLEQTSNLEELDIYFKSSKSAKYLDICVFHAEDSDIADKIRNSEIEFFRGLKNNL